jgi:hypothetical protein
MTNPFDTAPETATRSSNGINVDTNGDSASRPPPPPPLYIPATVPSGAWKQQQQVPVDSQLPASPMTVPIPVPPPMPSQASPQLPPDTAWPGSSASSSQTLHISIPKDPMSATISVRPVMSGYPTHLDDDDEWDNPADTGDSGHSFVPQPPVRIHRHGALMTVLFFCRIAVEICCVYQL